MEYEIKIPTELKDITLRQYKAYEKIIKANVTYKYKNVRDLL